MLTVVEQLKITSVTLSSAAFITTGFRLYIRRNRLWWDDYFAIFSSLVLVAQVCAVFMRGETEHMSRLSAIASYYMLASTFYVVIWSARLSILFSIIRIASPTGNRRRNLMLVGLLFMGCFAFLFGQLFHICERQAGWKIPVTPQCKLPKIVAICQLVSDIGADLILLSAPLHLLYGLHDHALRNRLFAIFSSCIVTTIVSLVHGVYILQAAPGGKIIISGVAEDCISLLVANLPVVITALFRMGSKTSNAGSSGLAKGGSWSHTGRGTKQNTVVNIATTIDVDQNDFPLSSLPSKGDEGRKNNVFNLGTYSEDDGSAYDSETKRKNADYYPGHAV